MIAVYAITDAAPVVPATRDLQLVASHGLVAFCGPAGERRLTPGLLWRHEQIVESLMETCDLLPVRYGTQVEDEAAVARVLASRRGELLAALDRVRGAVELSVRVAGELSDAESDAPLSGAEYLRAKAGAAARDERLADRVHGPLDHIARASRRRRQAGPAELARVAYLVDKGAIGAFAQRVAVLQRAMSELRILCTGPWPPYSFVGE